jgi:vacuolar-type H+-ATPase subunit H
MASETVKRVLNAESASREQIAAARADGERAELLAAEYAEKKLGERLAEAKERTDEMKADNRRKIEEMNARSAESCELEKQAITAEAEKRLPQAADAVIERLFG